MTADAGRFSRERMARAWAAVCALCFWGVSGGFCPAQTAYYVNDNSTDGDVWCSAVGDSGNDGLTVSTPLNTYDDVASPGIDAGNPADASYVNEPAPDGDRANQGAYGGTIYASSDGEPPAGVNGMLFFWH